MTDTLSFIGIQEYLTGLVPPRDPVLTAMEEHARELDFPIIGPTCGHLCYQIALMIGARKIFELGSGFGYSAAWFARAVKENGGGTVHHTVWDEELSRYARERLGALGYGSIMRYRVGEAVAALKRARGTFDLIFCDIDKQGYVDALPVIAKKLRSGGVFIADNMLWSGRIFDRRDRSPETQGIREFTRLLFADGGWVAAIVPIRDGLLIARKK
jgi:caffeoyl-CoA O-methyltransferase